MFLEFDVIRQSLDELSSFHPFFGITFLVAKEANLPVGRTVSIEINNQERIFLETFYKPDPNSSWYFQPFRTSSREGRWLTEKYPFSGSQSTRTKSDLAAAFHHEKGTKLWGWRTNYVQVLRDKLNTDRSGRIPAFWLATWLYRNFDFGPQPTAEQLVERFLSDFSITDEERDELFRLSVPDLRQDLWSELAYRDAFLLRVIEPAPDAKSDEGASLRRLQIQSTGPVDLTFEPADRLSVITGDNGLGKSFLLECSWWALTGYWAEREAIPRRGNTVTRPPEMRLMVANQSRDRRPQIVRYDLATGLWIRPKVKEAIPGVVIYARVDGSFAVWDPARHYDKRQGTQQQASVFTNDEVFFGDADGKIEGLLRDWVSWQRDHGSQIYSLFKRVLRKLSPPDMAPLEPGEPTRLPGKDTRTIPTVRHDYGEIPVTLESAGVKRILTLAYLLVWAWNEHLVASSFSEREIEKNLVVMIDEMESHLHPKWQRVVLPALLDVLTYLSPDLYAQVIVATHSPLILASCEEVFSAEVDKLFHLSLDSGKIAFAEVPFVMYGTVDSWLTSDIFSLGEARSRSGEDVVERAKQLMTQDAPSADHILSVNNDLRHVLPEDDELWVRWLFFARFKGVEL